MTFSWRKDPSLDGYLFDGAGGDMMVRKSTRANHVEWLATARLTGGYAQPVKGSPFRQLRDAKRAAERQLAEMVRQGHDGTR